MYLDLVVCKHDGDNKPYLFAAPAWSHLGKGDKVVVDTRNGIKAATVHAVCTVEQGSEAYVCLAVATGAKEPLRKVIAKTVYAEFCYPEEAKQ